MMHHEKHGRKKARSMLSKAGYANCGGHFARGGHVKSDKAQDAKMVAEGVHEHESALHKGEKKTKLRLKDGGCADGGMAKPRADRLRRGGKTKHGKPHTQVNIAIGRSHPQPVPVPKPVPVPVPAGGPPGAGPMAGPPPGAGPMPPPDGGGAPPMGLKRGGRAKRADGGALKDILIGQGLKGASQALPLAMAALKKGGKVASDSGRDMKGGMPAGHFKKGGRTKVYPIDDGAGGGLGRLEKAKAYGA